LCEDFESFAAGGPPKGRWASSGKVSVVTGIAYSGSKSLHVVTSNNITTNDVISTSSGLPISNNDVFGRVMVYFKSANTKHLRLVRMEGNGAGAQYLVASLNGALHFEYDPAGGGESFGGGDSKWPTNKWVCMEWEFNGSKAAGAATPADEARGWFDGIELTQSNVKHKGAGCCGSAASVEWTAPTFSKFSIGAFPPSSDLEYWLDDVELADKKIGCPAK